jgi:hypothetical protein
MFVCYFIGSIMMNRVVGIPPLDKSRFVKIPRNLYYILLLSGNCKRVRPKSEEV